VARILGHQHWACTHGADQLLAHRADADMALVEYGSLVRALRRIRPPLLWRSGLPGRLPAALRMNVNIDPLADCWPDLQLYTDALRIGGEGTSQTEIHL